MPAMKLDVEIQGHRGMMGELPENTLLGFSAAIDAGVDTIELDVVCTADRHFVVYHDLETNPVRLRTMQGELIPQRPLRTLSLSEIKQLDCGSIPHLDFPEQRVVPRTQIPTLAEVLELIRPRDVRLSLDIKRDPHLDPKDLAKQLVAQIRDSGLEDRIDYHSFDPMILSEIRRLDHNVRIGLIFEERDLEKMISSAIHAGARILSLDHTLLPNRDHVQTLKNLGFRVLAWSVNDPERWEDLIDMGVDGLITDYPRELVQFISDNKKVSLSSN